MGIRPLWQSDRQDTSLVRYLHDKSKFSYLRGKTSRKEVAKLAVKGRHGYLGSAEEEHGVLLRLWPLVLTDALRSLKKKDSREWTKSSGIDFDSFFNEDSLGVPQLQKVVEAFADFEPLLYGASPQRYRDHVAHSFRVWIIGQKILRKGFSGRLHLSVPDLPKAGLPKEWLEIGPVEWECIWALTALCHDIGYPLSKVDLVNDRAKETLKLQGLRSLGDMRFAFSAGEQPFYRIIAELMSSKVVLLQGPNKVDRKEKRFLTHVQNKYYLKFLNAFDRLDHGIISALLMAKSLVYFLESDLCLDDRHPLDADDARQFLIRREILRAVSSHDCPDVYHLKFNSLGFLLFLVDELQGWGRPTFGERHRGGSHDAQGEDVVIHAFGPEKVHVEVTTGRTWDKEEQGRLYDRLRRMQRRLRLAVDAPSMKDLFLVFAVTDDEGLRAELRLEEGRIRCTKPKKT
ncbi:MAG: hypothetical protein ACYS9X_17705 [Planctomycetota bacterium]|jgi:hypothetical protein